MNAEMVKNEIKNLFEKGRSSFSKTALLAADFMVYLKRDQNDPYVSLMYGPDDVSLYVFDPVEKIYKFFDEFSFKKNFIRYIKEEYGEDHTLRFSSADMSDIYNLIKVNSPYIDFDFIPETDSGHPIININGQMFDLTTREFIEWKDEYKTDCPILFTFVSKLNNDKISGLFKNFDIDPDAFVAYCEGIDYGDDDISSEVDSGISVFNLNDIPFKDINDLYYEYDEEDDDYEG